MAYVVAVTWRAKPGEEEQVAELAARIARLSREEPGCRAFVAHRSVEDPRTFFLYEQYDDLAAFEAHGRTEHVARYVAGDVVHRLEHRERADYETLE